MAMLVGNGTSLTRSSTSALARATAGCCYVQAFKCSDDSPLDLWARVNQITGSGVFWTGLACAYWGGTVSICAGGTLHTNPAAITYYATCAACSAAHPFEPPIHGNYPCCRPALQDSGPLILITSGIGWCPTEAECYDLYGAGIDWVKLDILPNLNRAWVYPNSEAGEQYLNFNEHYGHFYAASGGGACGGAPTDLIFRLRARLFVVRATIGGESCITDMFFRGTLEYGTPVAGPVVTIHGSIEVFSFVFSCVDGVLVAADPSPTTCISGLTHDGDALAEPA